MSQKNADIMEIMEEGILMDRLPILLQRDMQYYEVLLFSIITDCLNKVCYVIENNFFG